MVFLASMFTLLGTTLISLILNFECWKNLDKPRDSDKFIYQDLFLPNWMYEETYVIIVTLICITICSCFIFLVA